MIKLFYFQCRAATHRCEFYVKAANLENFSSFKTVLFENLQLLRTKISDHCKSLNGAAAFMVNAHTVDVHG